MPSFTVCLSVCSSFILPQKLKMDIEKVMSEIQDFELAEEK